MVLRIEDSLVSFDVVLIRNINFLPSQLVFLLTESLPTNRMVMDTQQMSPWPISRASLFVYKHNNKQNNSESTSLSSTKHNNTPALVLQLSLIFFLLFHQCFNKTVPKQTQNTWQSAKQIRTCIDRHSFITWFGRQQYCSATVESVRIGLISNYLSKSHWCQSMERGTSR